MIKEICRENQYTENELRAIFPDSVVKNVGPGFIGFKTVFIDRDKAKEHDFFTNAPIQLKDKAIVISRQWNASNFQNFKQVVKKQFNIVITEQ